MKKENYRITIIGAGLSGLTAAYVLEQYGYHPTIIEATDTVGGRVQSTLGDGYILDHGFQVLLTAYPMCQKYLDYEGLQLREFQPGAAIFRNKKIEKIGDPLRAFQFAWPTLFSTIGSLRDKWKVFTLNQKVKKKTIDSIFSSPETTTLDYLLNYGFSHTIIENFFKPFFGGIFLEEELRTSSRMFEFIYKMFGEGYAALPENGIGEIALQLRDMLQQTQFLFTTKVSEVRDGWLRTEDGRELQNHMTIVATEASSLVANLRNQRTSWKSCDTLYFEIEQLPYQEALVGLVPGAHTLSNTLCFSTQLQKNEGEKSLVSVTVVREHNLDNDTLVSRIKTELKDHCGLIVGKCIQRITIPQALPELNNVQYGLSASETRLTTQVFLAGDVLLNGSLNAAMMSGQRAAEGVIQAIEDGLVVGELTSEFT